MPESDARALVHTEAKGSKLIEAEFVMTKRVKCPVRM